MTPKEARAYIKNFSKHTVPGAEYVDTATRRIHFNDMSDEDALFVANDLIRIENEAAQRREKGNDN